MTKVIKLAITGFGNAVKPLVELFVSERERLLKNAGVAFTLVGAADSRGAIVAPEGISAEDLLRVRADTGSVSNFPQFGYPNMTALEMIGKCNADLLVEGLPPNLPTAEPGYSHIKQALQLGMHVVTANKAPLALHWTELNDLAIEAGVQLRVGSAASAGLPTIEMGRLLGKTGELLEMAGIFNATCQYILEGMRDGQSYEDALKDAQARGFVEPDPSMDIDGWDTAMKTVIQANAYWDAGFTLDDVKRTGIAGLSLSDVQKAAKEGKTWCLVGRASVENGKKISVSPECLDVKHPLAQARWCDKVLLMNTRTLGEQVHFCLGASASGTAGTMLVDIVDIGSK